ncbi:PREDICTED: von Willebrand factor A domain-containing protein 9-like, partial [Mesitornis unicolor]|uniref:von Willebrand factor A domain-containing protein 9-like n=1 Tax=Mesitornis unicolor TaxID=54374 RepID=UPI000528A668
MMEAEGHCRAQAACGKTGIVWGGARQSPGPFPPGRGVPGGTVSATDPWRHGGLRQITVFRGGSREEPLTMPTVVVMDVSLSMTRPVSVEGSEEYQRKHLAVHGLTMLFEHMATNYKLEFTALVVFSSLWELMVPFTRDYNTLQEALSNMDDYDKTCLESALLGVCNIVQQEWGAAIPCQ